jgi:hypothetical protein
VLNLETGNYTENSPVWQGHSERPQWSKTTTFIPPFQENQPTLVMGESTSNDKYMEDLMALTSYVK